MQSITFPSTCLILLFLVSRTTSFGLLPQQADSTISFSSIDNGADVVSSRRNAMLTFGSIVVGGLATSVVPGYAIAADANEQEKTIWLTGKPPKIPGQNPKNKGDLSGTKKDPGFLRSISDCKSQCENTPGPDGYAKTKEDCLSECQDICCTTYEQCTFAIVPRI